MVSKRDKFTQTENNKKRKRAYDMSSEEEEPKYYFPDEEEYYNNLPRKKQRLIDNIEKKITDINHVKTPLRFKILESDMDIRLKALAINKIEKLNMIDTSSGEYLKLNTWIENLCKLPIILLF